MKSYLILSLTSHLVKKKNQMKWRICGPDYGFTNKTLNSWTYHFRAWFVSEAVNIHTHEGSSVLLCIFSLEFMYYYLGQNFCCGHRECWEEMVTAHLGGSWLQENSWVSQARVFGSSRLPENSDRESGKVLPGQWVDGIGNSFHINHVKLWDLLGYSEGWLGCLL